MMTVLRSYRREGYAFPMALAAIVIITLVVGVAASQVERAIAAYSQQTDLFAKQVAARSAESTFLYHALTSPMGNLGVEIGGVSAIDRMFDTGSASPSDTVLLRANAQPRLFDDTIVLRYIDQQAFFSASMLGISGRDDDMTSLGISPVRHASLGAALRDFQDEDVIRTPGGAETSAYDDPRLPPNRPLIDPVELCEVSGWTQEDICSDVGQLLLLTMVRGSGQLNPRLASPFLLERLTGSWSDARRAVAGYEDGTYTQFADAGRPEYDNVSDIFEVPGGATGRFALVAHDRSAQVAWISVYELTPRNVLAPFSLAYRYRIGGQYVRDALGTSLDEPIEPLPDPGQ